MCLNEANRGVFLLYTAVSRYSVKKYPLGTSVHRPLLDGKHNHNHQLLPHCYTNARRSQTMDDRGHPVHHRLRVLLSFIPSITTPPPFHLHKHNPDIRELRPLSASQPCKPLAIPSILTELPPIFSGIATAQNGERHIPSSTRPVGSKRKEIKNLFQATKLPKTYKNRTAVATGREQVLLLAPQRKNAK